MHIYAKYDKGIKRMEYHTNNGREYISVNMFYRYPLDEIHVVACNSSGFTLDFMAKEFSGQNAVDLLQLLAKAYF